jgi:hypothetical protein
LHTFGRDARGGFHGLNRVHGVYTSNSKCSRSHELITRL